MEEILDDQFLEEKPNQHKKGKWFYFFLGIFSMGAILSSAIAWYNVESVIGSAPTMSVIGVILSLIALKNKSKRIALLGLLPFAISVFWFFMVELFSLSPSDCRINIPTSLSLASSLALYLGIPFFRK